MSNENPDLSFEIEAWPGTDLVCFHLLDERESVAELTLRLSEVAAIHPGCNVKKMEGWRAEVTVTLKSGVPFAVMDTPRRDIYKHLQRRLSDFIAKRGSAFECARPMESEA